MKRYVVPIALFTLLIGPALAGAAQTGHVTPFTGTWKLNPAKSTFDPGPPPRDFTLTFASDGTRHIEVLGTQGPAFRMSLPWSDGNEVEVQAPEGMGKVTATSKIEGRELHDTWKLNGKVFERFDGVLSPDGAALTLTIDGTRPNGHAYRNRLTFDKVVEAASPSAAAPTAAAKPPEKKYQARAPKTQPFGAEAFAASGGTTLRWLGMAGFLINSRGTTLMVDPLLEGFDMPLLIEMPIAPKDVPRLDAVLVTHSDNDHFSKPTDRDLARVTRAYHATKYVASLMKDEHLPAEGHAIGDVFEVGPVRVKVTPADHAWQNAYAGASPHHFEPEDACGFWIETPDGTIWAPGDSRLIPEHHLRMPAPDALFFDFSDSEWHFGLAGAVKIANAYPDTPLLLYHWGSVDAPDFAPFNADPKTLEKLVVNPGRIRVLAPGEAFTLTRVKPRAK